MEHQLLAVTQVAQQFAVDPVAGFIFSQSTRWLLIGLALIILLELMRIPILITELRTRRQFKKQLQKTRRSE